MNRRSLLAALLLAPTAGKAVTPSALATVKGYARGGLAPARMTIIGESARGITMPNVTLYKAADPERLRGIEITAEWRDELTPTLPRRAIGWGNS